MFFEFIPNDLKIDFIGIRKISYIFSAVIILVGLISLFYHGGLKYGIDFAGGATVQVKMSKPISDEDLKKSLADAQLPGLAIQSFGTDGTTYLLRISTVEETSTGINKQVQDALSANLQGMSYEIQRLEMVGPKVGADLRAKALQAIYLAILITAVYISGRFEKRWFTAAGVAAILAIAMAGLEFIGFGKEILVAGAIVITILMCIRLKLVFALGTIVSILHDVLVTVGIFSLLDKEFDLTIIAALLTVVGYSLNDTIIVYDRIRENLRNSKDEALSSIINRSINQTLSRTILTSGSTLFVVLALLFFGGSMLRDFSLIMAIGVVVGTFSSIFVASPILLIFGDKLVIHDDEPDNRPRDKDGRLAPQV